MVLEANIMLAKLAQACYVRNLVSISRGKEALLRHEHFDSTKYFSDIPGDAREACFPTFLR
jgi:hypothetical protein